MGEHRLRIDYLLHIFALAHALVVVLSRTFNYFDDVPLTLLTILMIAIIAIRRNLQVEVIAALALLGCFIGYGLGVYGAKLIGSIIGDGTAAPTITTMLVTELLGWLTYGVSKFRSQSPNAQIRYLNTPVIVTVAAAILIIRITYVQLFSAPFFSSTNVLDEVRGFASNTYAIVTLLGGCIMLVSFPFRLRVSHPRVYLLTVAVLLLSLTLVITLFTYYNFPSGNGAVMDRDAMLRLYLVLLPVCVAVYAVLLLIRYVVTTRMKLRDERDRRHKALYQYNTLKQQINPHFLFNSLNILDFLVEEGDCERASAFIRKLAGMYRYMLQNEEKQIVPLGEELAFVRMYIDLLRERFAEGLSVEIDVSKEAMGFYVIPCSVQMLVENATKHNIIGAQEPLTVRITDCGDMLSVSNNLQPRISGRKSTGLGLKNIRQQYEDVSGLDIVVEHTKTEFCVKLPLLQAL